MSHYRSGRPTALNDWIEGVVLTLILSGVIGFLDYLAINWN